MHMKISCLYLRHYRDAGCIHGNQFALPLQSFSDPSGPFLPLHKELVDLLQRSCNLETTSFEHALSAALTGIHLVRQEGAIKELLQQGGRLLEVIEQLKALMEEHHIPLPTDLSTRYREVASQHKKLASQVSTEKQSSLTGRELQVRRYYSSVLRPLVPSVRSITDWFVCVCVCVEPFVKTVYASLRMLLLPHIAPCHCPAVC